MSSAQNSRHTIISLTDLPGIGPTKAKWLVEAGIHDVSSISTAPVDQIAHVRGVGYALAVRLKELVDDHAELSDAQAEWRERVSALRQDIDAAVDELLEDPGKRALKPKFIRQLQRLRVVMRDLPVDHPPDDSEHRRKISKHGEAIRALLRSAVLMDEECPTHQRILRDLLRTRRKKLDMWI